MNKVEMKMTWNLEQQIDKITFEREREGERDQCHQLLMHQLTCHIFLPTEPQSHGKDTTGILSYPVVETSQMNLNDSINKGQIYQGYFFVLTNYI